MSIFISNIMGIEMRGRKSILIMLLLTASGIAYGLDTSEQPRVEVKGGAPALVLPNSLVRFISQQYPDLRVPTRTDILGPWATFNRKDAVPYACWGRFDDKGKTDVALILLGKEEWHIFAFHPLENGQYAVLPLEDYSGSTKDFTRAHSPQEFYVSNLKAGETLIIGGKKIPETQHAHDAVAFFSLKDPQTGILYQWMPARKADKLEYRYGLYIASIFGALSD